ncbi:hypothetical protein MIND_00502500 [Mycena indigotica]|uniref:WHIM1 domain-containing protein n=1 Tax=Mycena indigotica TaxID=2126181 RepID=A0A8H6SZD6_9AGAR|nr:uncharacterized protein MIND_00502500 [Mycena indigotica]KAF7307092.1 hypothetical protein MIND_00502500 [Mycena indigotica]
MSDSSYDFRPGGSLKLKGVADGGIKKKKKKSKTKPESEERLKDLIREEAVASGSSQPGSGSNSPAPSAPSDRKTDAERRFEQIQRRRLSEKVAKVAAKSHKDRVSEFNAHLESLSEHHDIPKVFTLSTIVLRALTHFRTRSDLDKDSFRWLLGGYGAGYLWWGMVVNELVHGLKLLVTLRESDSRHPFSLLPHNFHQHFAGRMASSSSATAKANVVGHVCPPTSTTSPSTHPSGRWESLFVYSFICRFTNLREKIEGLETPMDFEEALLSQEPNPILTQVLAGFILNLRPQTRNLSIDQISTTVATVLSEYLKSSERSIFWDDTIRANKDPFESIDGGFFTADWDFKLKILRQLVELQLTHSADVRATVDRAWGVSSNKHKKKDATSAPPEDSDPLSQKQLQLVPLGQDLERTRYWAADDSPRLYTSTNPWKVTATFHMVTTTLDEYKAIIKKLQDAIPPHGKGEKRPKMEKYHLHLIQTLESRTEAIEAELVRVEKARKKLEQKQVALARAAEAELLRETRTRRQTRKPNYVYSGYDEEDEGDEYTYQEAERDEFEDDDFLNFRDEEEDGRHAGRRRSTRTAVLNANGKREAQEDPWSSWRGERRSTRLGAPPETQLDIEPPSKRARTEDSAVSTGSGDGGSTTSHGVTNGNGKLQSSVVAALRPNEVALEQIAGKKRSKFWVYAVEPGTEPEAAQAPEPSENGALSMDGGESVNGQESDMQVDGESTNGRGGS